MPQTPESQLEARTIMSIRENINTGQSCGSIFGIVQDGLLGSYRMTKDWIPIDKDDFYQHLMNIKGVDIHERMNQVKQHYDDDDKCFTGRGLVSMILPPTFDYKRDKICIQKGVIISGTLDKSSLGAVPGSIQSCINIEYGPDVTVNFINNIQAIAISWIEDTSYSIGFDDSKPNCSLDDEIRKALVKADITESEVKDDKIREMKVTSILGSTRNKCEKIVVDKLSLSNCFRDPAASGSKGSFGNVTQIMGLLGQQHVLGQRMPSTVSQGSRTLPCFPFHFDTTKEDQLVSKYQSRGFVMNSFYSGLHPVEQWFHAIAGREGVIDTAIRTSDSGYIQRKLIKKMEDLIIHYDGTVRNSHGNIIQFLYGDDNFDGAKLSKVDDNYLPCDIGRLVSRLNNTYTQRPRDFIDLLVEKAMRKPKEPELVFDEDLIQPSKKSPPRKELVKKEPPPMKKIIDDPFIEI